MPKQKKTDPIKYGQYLAQLRLATGLSQREFARQLGVPQSNLTFWEHSDKPPRSEILPKLADLLGVSIEQLLRPALPHLVQKKSGPIGRARILFDRLHTLPRHQQVKILDLIDAFISQFELANLHNTK